MFFIDPSSHDIGRSQSSEPAAYTPSVRRGLAIDPEDFQLSPTASSSRFSFHLLRSSSPLESGYWNLRSAIFCQEQHLFELCDRDDLDHHAYPIAALDHAGDPLSEGENGVVGVVRIVEQEPRLWFGGRLGVHSDYRRLNQIGKGLIWKAVTTANGWGCDRFLATVQIQNVRFFRRLHWATIEPLEIRGITHHLMEADLSYYLPSREPRPQLGRRLSGRAA